VGTLRTEENRTGEEADDERHDDGRGDADDRAGAVRKGIGERRL
jgi:hypothetical protein